MVLDITMPGEDGLALCRHLRETTRIPVILLTAMGEETDRIVGLEVGADDYVAKPFNPRELLARIKAVIRRAQSLPPDREPLPAGIWRFDRWSLDTGKRELVDEAGVVTPLSSGMAGAGDSLVKQYPPATHQFLEVPFIWSGRISAETLTLDIAWRKWRSGVKPLPRCCRKSGTRRRMPARTPAKRGS